MQRWDDNLALVARYNAIRCYIKHDKVRSTEKYPFVGQNLGYLSKTLGHYSLNQFLDNMMTGLYDGEHIYASMSYIQKMRLHPTMYVSCIYLFIFF